MTLEIRTVMKTRKVATKAVIKMPHLKVSAAKKKRGPNPSGSPVTPPVASHIVGDKHPAARGGADATEFPTCHSG